METFEQPKITGYRQLTESEVAIIDEIKDIGESLDNLVEYLQETSGVDQRWVAIGKTNLQQGIMALVRAVARPESF